jgi:anti-anti-sigma factor
MRDAPLSHTTETGSREGTTVLKLVGPLTLFNMFGIQNELRAMNPPLLILDLSEVPYMDSAGLGLLMNVHVSAENGGRKFLLANVNERVGALLSMTKVDSVLAIFPSTEAAEASARS